MLTRSRARKQRTAMDSVSTEEEFPINNQLGMPDIFDEETEAPNREEDTRAGEPAQNIVEPSPYQTTPIHTTQTESHKKAEQPQIMNADINMLMQAMRQMQESLQSDNTQLREEIKNNNIQMREANDKAHEQTRQIIIQLERKIDKQIEDMAKETNAKLQEQNTKINNIIETVQQNTAEARRERELHETRVMDTVNKTVEKVEGVTAELRQEVRHTLQESKDQQTELRRELVQNMQEQKKLHEDSVKEVQNAVHEIGKKQRKTEDNLKETKEKSEQTSEELRGRLRQIQRRMEGVEERRGPPPRELLNLTRWSFSESWNSYNNYITITPVQVG